MIYLRALGAAFMFALATGIAWLGLMLMAG